MEGVERIVVSDNGQYVGKWVLSERWKSFSSMRSPACSRTELRRRERPWGVPGGERPVRNASELDSAGCLGEPAGQVAKPGPRSMRLPAAICRQAVEGKPVTLRGNVLKRWRGASRGWRRNGWKAEPRTPRDLSGTRHGRTGVREAIVAEKPGNSGGAKGFRKMDDA
jgi:hypothetical protein